MNVAMPVGTRLPAYATCVGRVLLAALDTDALDGKTKALIGLPQHWLQEDVREGMERVCTIARSRGVAIAIEDIRAIALTIFIQAMRAGGARWQQ